MCRSEYLSKQLLTIKHHWLFCMLTGRDVDCGGLPNIANGLVVLSGTTSGSTAGYSCNVGYRLSGVRIRVCLGTGQWSDSEPVCRCESTTTSNCLFLISSSSTATDCGSLTAPDDGEVTFTGTGFGAIARYRCNQGFVVVGVASRTCKSDGTWSGSAPTCSRECHYIPFGSAQG